MNARSGPPAVYPAQRPFFLNVLTASMIVSPSLQLPPMYGNQFCRPSLDVSANTIWAIDILPINAIRV